jgi:ribose transport system ATP-binding protein
LPEVLGTCDRIAVMCRGRVTAVKVATEWTEESIMAAAVGHAEANA